MEQNDHKKIKSFLLFELGEIFFEIITLNADGVSGDSYIRNNIKITEIRDILSLYKEKSLYISNELNQYSNLMESIIKTAHQLNNIIDHVDQTNLSLKSRDVFEKNFKSFLGSYLIVLNKKKKLNITVDQMFIPENEPTLLEMKTKIRDKYWTPAFEQNYQDSVNSTYETFKFNIRENPYIETMKFVSF